jgi:hypothetical protein
MKCSWFDKECFNIKSNGCIDDEDFCRRKCVDVRNERLGSCY